LLGFNTNKLVREIAELMESVITCDPPRQMN
jgi:hypothetical protein